MPFKIQIPKLCKNCGGKMSPKQAEAKFRGDPLWMYADDISEHSRHEEIMKQKKKNIKK